MSEAAAATGGTMSKLESEELNQAKLGMWLFLGSEVMFFTGFFAAYIVLRSSNEIAADQAHLNKVLAAINTVVRIISSLTMALAVRAIQTGNVKLMRVFIAATIACAFGFMVIKYVEYSAKLNIVETMTLSDGEELSNLHKDSSRRGRDLTLTEATKGWNFEDYEAVDLPAGTVLSGKNIAGIETAFEEDEITEVKVSRPNPYDPAYSIFFAAYFTLTGFHGLHVLAGIAVLLYILICANKWSARRFAFVECTGFYWHFVDLVWIFLFPALYLI